MAGASGVWFNSRPKTALAEEAEYVRHVEIEALPYGGWGYSYFPYVRPAPRHVGRPAIAAAEVRRPLRAALGRPTLSHTGRFHKSSGDTGGLKQHAALLYECGQVLAQGMTVGMGDLLHPPGELNPRTWDQIGSVSAHVAACEPFVRDGRPLTDISVLVDPELGDTPGAAGFEVVRALHQLRHQFDLLPPDADVEGFPVVIVPEATPIDPDLAELLRHRAASGHAVLVSRGAGSGPAGVKLLIRRASPWREGRRLAYVPTTDRRTGSVGVRPRSQVRTSGGGSVRRAASTG